MTRIYLGAVAFGVTLLIASLVLGGKDTDHGGHAPSGEVGFGWAPITSLRFWIFLFAFGGGAGLALTYLGSSTAVSAIASSVIGWGAGAATVMIIRTINKNSVSSESRASDLIGMTGALTLPVGPNQPGKVRVDLKGRAEDFVANLMDESADTKAMPTGTSVLIVAEGPAGSVLIARSDD